MILASPVESIHAVCKALTIGACIGNPRTLLSSSFDFQTAVSFHDSHPAAFPPPAIDIAWQGQPKIVILGESRQVSQQLGVSVLSPLRNHVVRVNDAADQAMCLRNDADLVFPKFDRVVVQYVEQGVILSHGKRKLENSADEERRDRATPHALGIEMGYVGH